MLWFTKTPENSWMLKILLKLKIKLIHFDMIYKIQGKFFKNLIL